MQEQALDSHDKYFFSHLVPFDEFKRQKCVLLYSRRKQIVDKKVNHRSQAFKVGLLDSLHP